MATFSDLFARLDLDPRVRGKQFEHVCKWFLTNDPLYKQRLRHVWVWKEWPDRPGDTEAGIDLVAEDADGYLWAVQAKAYREDKPIPKAELNKFLSESNTKQFAQRLLISTTTSGLHQLAQRAMDAQEKPVTALDLFDLRAADAYLDWPESSDKLRPSRPPKPAAPHDYQRDAIRDVVKGFNISDRGQLIMACGTGKTLTSLFIKEKLGAERVLVLVPSLSLLKQTLREWMVNRRTDFDILPVCSDATVSRDEDAIVAHTSDLGVPVTTNSEDIARFLRRRGPRVVFATYQSSPQVAAAFAISRVPAFDLVLADEAHRCAGPVSSDFATVLDGFRIKARRRLFMTATPRVYSESSKRTAKDEEFEYASMDDREKFGEVFHRLGFSQAIERKVLTDYQVAVIGVDDATYREWAERGTFVTLDGKAPISARTLAGQIGLAKAMGKYDLRRTISFHSYVSRARDFAASMEKVIAWMPAGQRPAGSLWARYASGEMDAGKRSRLIRRLAALDDGERGLLSNARCLAEGVDVPTLDGVAFIDPRRSEVDIVQAVGRAIRKADNKKVGTVVIPVFIDTDTNPEVALSSSVFKPVWDVIRALRSHDEELGHQLDELRREMGRDGGKPLLPNKIHVDIPKKVDASFAEAFDVRLIKQTTASWELWFGLLEQFVEHNGHANPLVSYKVNGYPLGEWVSTQRDRRGSGTLDADRERRLKELTGWTWDPHADNWEEGFRHLLHYVERNGHVRIGQRSRVDGYPLGAWVNTQRSFFDRGTLKPDRQSRLEGVPGWTWDPRTDMWEKGFTRLLDYVLLNGDARVPRDCKSDGDGYDLGTWVKGQRRAFRKGELDADRQYRLESLDGWTWDPNADDWEEGYRHLLDYVEREGDALVRTSFNRAGGYPLGRWVSHQRNSYANGMLEAERARRLFGLTGWTWNARDASWEEGFSQLLNYIERNGNALVPSSNTQNGYPLGQWVVTQRQSRTKGTLGEDRERRLGELQGWMWNGRDAIWEESFRRLRDYVERNGDSLVQKRYKDVDGNPLGVWVMRQRTSYTQGTLAPDRERRLRLLPGWRWAR